jgi:uncharacterized membrane protein YoaK (UPF0700 family)
VFKREGPARGLRANTLLAGHLAATAGFVNSGGFVMIGSFTSHVTGSIGRFANDLANAEFAASFAALWLVLAFFGGAVASSLILEQRDAPLVPSRYALALAIEAGLLLTFVFVAGLSRTSHPLLLDAQALFLCAAMGIQNSLVTRLSGAVVRTTHLTGVLTDLGMETARWLRFHQLRVLSGTASPQERPTAARMWLLTTIVLSFVAGAALGAVLTARISRWAMCLPAGSVALASLFALLQGSPPYSVRPPAPR